MIYFTSDLHLGHKNIIKFADRPFDDIEIMNKILIDNFNSVVKQNDTVYILGDLAFRIKANEANNLIKKLNGRKILIKGNHDIKYDESLFEKVSDFEVIQYNKKKFCLMHYPMVSWTSSNYGSIQLHGHIHSSMPDIINNINNKIYRYDVGVDANNYYPVSIEDVLSIFDDRKIDWYIQKYDEDGYACKMPRVINGTKREAIEYMYGYGTIVDIIWNRTIKLYSSDDYKIDEIPKKIRIIKDNEIRV